MGHNVKEEFRTTASKKKLGIWSVMRFYKPR
jgi:hypothetical protein